MPACADRSGSAAILRICSWSVSRRWPARKASKACRLVAFSCSASKSKVTGRNGAGWLVPHSRSICVRITAFAAPSAVDVPAPAIRINSSERSITTHHSAKRASNAPVSARPLPGVRTLIIKATSRRESTVSHSTTLRSTVPASSMTPAASNSAATGSARAASRVSTLGRMARSPNSGESVSMPVSI